MDLDTALTGKPAEGAGATEILRADHEEVRSLFSEYERAKGGEQHARRVIAQAICLQLELHDTVEREIFYPAVREHDEARVDAAMAQHGELLDAVEQVKADADSGGDAHEAIERLRQLVEAHLRLEEDEIFPIVEKKLRRKLKDLGKDLIERKEALTRSTRSLEGPAT
jgi:hemerythrin superfamily protein